VLNKEGEGLSLLWCRYYGAVAASSSHLDCCSVPHTVCAAVFSRRSTAQQQTSVTCMDYSVRPERFLYMKGLGKVVPYTTAFVVHIVKYRKNDNSLTFPHLSDWVTKTSLHRTGREEPPRCRPPLYFAKMQKHVRRPKSSLACGAPRRCILACVEATSTRLSTETKRVLTRKRNPGQT